MNNMSHEFIEYKKHKFVDQKLQDIQDGNLELENFDGSPITTDFKECSVSFVIDLLEQTIDNILLRKWLVDDHQKKSLKILKEINQRRLNHSMCKHYDIYHDVGFE